MDNLTYFKQFAPKNTDSGFNGINAVIYTRVSDAKQEDNTSLESQKRICTNYAIQRGFNVVDYFGGTHESAKTDDRKEFNRMLTFVKRSKNITYIIVYSYERFSRSGVSGMQIAQELKKKYKVVTLSATQGIDPRTITGEFQQNLMFLVGQMENEQRKDKTLLGMKELLTKGYCPYSIPRGYVNLNKGKAVDQKIVLNAEGKILQKAFIWKAEQQMRNCEIIKQLAQFNVKMDERRLGEMFANPFYCGIIVSKMIPDQVIQGKHQAMISKEIFLKVNNVVTEARVHPVTHKFEDENLPLKRFVKCGACETPMTGFLVRKKNLYYYKCRTKGCNNNKSAKQLHEQFKAVLKSFQIQPDETELIKQGIEVMYESIFEEEFENQKIKKTKIKELDKKIEAVEENRAIGEITKEMHLKYISKYNTEKVEIEKDLRQFEVGSSNLQKCLNLVVNFCKNPLKLWENGKIWERTILQNIIFPRGILYNPKNDKVLTPLANAIFAPIPELIRGLKKIKKGENTNFSTFSSRVTATGFKPVTLRAEI